MLQCTKMRPARGFTLVEVMVAISILAIVTALTWGSFQQTFKAKSIVESNAVRYHSVRLTLERLAREISMAYLSTNEDATQAERRTFFIGRRRGDIDELRFSYFGHQRLYANADECDTAQVAYYAARDRNDSSRLNLVRRETRRESNLKMEQVAGTADILCDDVLRLQFDYWDARDKTWREEWVTTDAAGQPGRLPAKVKITLTVRDERGNEIPFSTEVRLPMQEALNFQQRVAVSQ
jgi:general secretion pathway protein J